MTSRCSKYLVIISLLLVFSSCFKQDKIIVLPPQTGSNVLVAPMGDKYDTTVYINLQKAEIVKKVNNLNWDLRFDASANGYTALMNTGNAVRMYETSFQNIVAVNNLNEAPQVWGYDAPNSLLDSAYFKNWHTGNGVSKNKVYVVRMGDNYFLKTAYYKMNILSANQSQYVVQFDTLTGSSPKTVIVPKDPNKNFVYLSLRDAKVVDGEPNKNEWDIVATRYSEIFHITTPPIVYPVNGLLINSCNTRGGGDTSKSYVFNNFNSSNINDFTLVSNENIIGYNWKSFSTSSEMYATNSKLVYIVHTQRNEYYKLRFLDFYRQGEKGFPKIEFQRIQ